MFDMKMQCNLYKNIAVLSKWVYYDVKVIKGEVCLEVGESNFLHNI